MSGLTGSACVASARGASALGAGLAGPPCRGADRAPSRVRRPWSWCTSRPRGRPAREVPLWQVGGRAFFTKEIDRALLEGSGRSRRAQPQGPVDPARARAHAGRHAAARGCRAMPSSATTARPLRSCRRARASAPAACAAAPSSRACGRISSTSELRGNVPTRVERLRERRLRRHHPRRRRPGAPEPAPARLRAAAAGGVPAGGLAGRHRCVRARRAMPRRCAGCCRWMTASRAWRRPPSARCCAASRAAARCRSAPWPRSPTGCCGWRRPCARWMAASRSRRAAPRPPRSRSGSPGQRVADELLARGAGELIARDAAAARVEPRRERPAAHGPSSSRVRRRPTGR